MRDEAKDLSADAAHRPRSFGDGVAGYADRLRIERDGSVALVRLARADRHNALDLRMFEAICAAQSLVVADHTIRAVVLHGEGQSFCAGLDLDAAQVFLEEPARALFHRRDAGGANLFQRAALGWRDMDVPVVSALHGSVFGGGLQLAMGADVRIADPATRLSIKETNWGLVPDMGGTILFEGQVRPDVLRQLVFGASTISAAEAVGAGLVTRIAGNVLDEASSLARHFAAASPRALRAAKRLLNKMPFSSAPDLLAAETREQLMLLGDRDQIEALAAHRDRRAPSFADA